jgi:hypothetical protein
MSDFGLFSGSILAAHLDVPPYELGCSPITVTLRSAACCDRWFGVVTSVLMTGKR